MAKHEIFSCILCSKVFTTRSRFNQHSKTHSKPWRCKVCAQGFALRTDLNRHTKSKHFVGHQLFNCKECESAFTRKDNLTHHIKTRHATSPRFPEKRPSLSTAIDQAAEALPDWLLLTQSASNGNLGSVERLLDSVCDIDLRADDGSTALHCAARAGQTAVLEVLIRRGANVNVPNHKSRYPIYEAVIGGHTECFYPLLEAGTDLAKLFWAPYRLSSNFSELVVQTGDYKLVEAILAVTPTDRHLTIVDHLLKAAAKMGQVAILHNLLNPACTAPDKELESVNCTSRQTILHYAVRQGYKAAVEYLLPLHQGKETLVDLLKTAAREGQVEICKILLADSPTINMDDALYYASRFGKLPVLEVLISHQGAVRARTNIDLSRPILVALWNDRLDSLRYLVSKDSWIARSDKIQYDVLSRVELVKCLLQYGILKISDQAGEQLAEYRQSSEYYDRNGTLLHLAVVHHDLDLARYVIQHKSFDSSILERNHQWYRSQRYRNGYVKTALDIAQFRGYTEIASLLIAHGAIDHNIAPKKSPRTEKNQAQPFSPDSDGDNKMQDLADSDGDQEMQDLSDTYIDAYIDADIKQLFPDFSFPCKTIPSLLETSADEP